ncbi:MAG: GTPase Era [Bacteroidales bacterium]|nr:GTPase Era [Bacteroidales bacterium]
MEKELPTPTEQELNTDEQQEPSTSTTPQHKAGFVNIVGNPNVGKSTLMNDLVGERVSIITSKAQTTRHRIMGIVNTPEYQIVFSDTPGVLAPKYKLQEQMLGYSEGALTDADILLYVTDVVEDPTKNADFLAKVAKEKIPVLLVINKVDLVKSQQELEQIVDMWKKLLPNAEIYPTSAKEHFNTDNLMRRIVELLPVSPPYFGKDALTDKPARFFVTEIIREKILTNYDKEVPYSVEVIVEKFDEKEGAIHIMAVIYVERNSQKGILIGKGGSKLKKVGMEARKDIEAFFGKKVYLELFVKVEANWRNRENKLRAFGYID